MKWILTFGAFLFIFLFPHQVGAEGDLQQLINEVGVNDVLQLEDRTYEGNIAIDKPITIKGSEGTVIRGNETGNVIMINADHVNLEQLQIENSSFSRNDEEEYSGVKVYSNDNVMKNLTIIDAYHGIYLSQSHRNTIENVTIYGQKDQDSVGAQGNGIQVYYSHENILKGNRIESTRDGIYFEYADENQIYENAIRHTRYGLHYMYSNKNIFKQNIFTFNIGGAAVMHSSENVFLENTFSMNQSSRSFGFLLQTSSDNLIEGNHFLQNKRGLLIEHSQNNLILNNEFSQNDIGIELWASARDQVFSENSFHKNKLPVIRAGGHSENEWSKGGRGNNWGSDFPLLDLYQTGVGDFAVTYDSSLHELVEENEFVYLFMHSPSIVIYEKLNQWTNNQETMFQDDFPLQQNRRGISFVPISIAFLLVSGMIFVRQKRRVA
ncbi:nitrous oxide reductase family maturation protein NosD [Bacillus shivajii]|uniref:nitrous oxide reductase family maturation protein NosD n=1 Tax=Bacillus shivajii TaxID=1983719 RepID=UPI001CFAD43A|nr:nitrous oxide reductase family maturation protein NosD [Bacillus shivajii]UCZ54050.1 nitrous oxide reductase family maturation protein NosD [Bacillus shivajii]